MNNRNKLRTLRDLQEEKQRVRHLIRQQEKKITGDYHSMIHSITPVRVITSVTGKIVSNAPALFTAYSLIRGFFRKKR